MDEAKRWFEDLLPDLIEYRDYWQAGYGRGNNPKTPDIRKKLTELNKAGGNDLAKKVCNLFEEYDEKISEQRNAEIDKELGSPDNYVPLNLTGAFDVLADSIVDGWYS